MIDNTNTTNNGTSESSIKKYIGVASINIVAINPNNEKLRKYGWQIPEGADEPTYTAEIERDGKKVKTCRVRFLVQMKDFDVTPVIPIDFWVHNEYDVNKDGNKCRIIDSYGRTAWATKDDVRAKRIPQYSNGPASISEGYSLCHVGEDKLIAFLFKYLNITPYRVFDRTKNEMVESKNPGRLTIDDWTKLCNGDVSEIAEYVALQPDNCVKVILGIRTTEDNKTYQTFFSDGYLSNGSFVDPGSGEYAQARKLIDKFMESYQGASLQFSSKPVSEWTETATEVKDNSNDLFTGETDSSDEETVTDPDDEELPF